MKTIEERLKKLLGQPAQPDAQARPGTPAEVDYNLLSRYAAGTASAEDAARIAALKQQDPELAELVEEPGKAIGGVLHMPPRVSRHMFQFLAVAASALVVAGIGWMVHSKSMPQQSVLCADAERMPMKEMVRVVQPAPESVAAPAPMHYAKAAPTTKAALPSSVMAKAESKPAATVATARIQPSMKAKAGAVPPRYNTYALLIGVDRNEHDAALRNGAIEDVRQVATKLHEFEFDQVVTLTNALATREQISGTLASFERVAATNASLFVYCAGDAPDMDDLPRNACLVPFDNAAMDARKNMQVEEKVASAPTVFNNSFVVYDNRVPRMQMLQQQQRIAPTAMNVAQRQVAQNVQVMFNVNGVQRNVSNVFAQAFIGALDQASVGGSVSADDVQGYVARQQIQSADMYANGVPLGSVAKQASTPSAAVEASDEARKDADKASSAASSAVRKENMVRDNAGQAACARATAATVGGASAGSVVVGGEATNGVQAGVATSQVLNRAQNVQKLETQAMPSRQMFQFRRMQNVQTQSK